MRVLVSMGIKPRGRASDPLEPLLVELDTERREVVRTLGWTTPTHARSGPDSDQEFTAASFDHDGRLLQPTHTEILVVDVERWRVDSALSHPAMHSIHSATPTERGVMLTSSGSEAVLHVNRAGELLERIPLTASAPDAWSEPDLRRAHHDAFKPHQVHPNHAAMVGGELWVTSLNECRCRVGAGRAVDFGTQMPHDGRLRGGLVWFTLVDGFVVGVDPSTLEVVRRLDLRSLSRSDHMLGWCRGVDVVGDRMFVGMTMLRRTTHREVLRRILMGAGGVKLPTRVLEIDLAGPRLVAEYPLGNRAGGTIYGVNVRAD
jgi:hypothetical protein